MKIALISASIIILLILAGFSIKYESDEDAWQKEQDALVRLRSGMQYESILMVRTRLADADAAVEDYASRQRIFPLRHTGAVKDARKAIDYFSEALEWNQKATSDAGVDVDQGDLMKLASYLGVTKSVARSCQNGELAVSPQTVAAIFALYGAYWTGAAEGRSEVRPEGPNPPLEPDRELQQCRHAQLLAVQAQDAANKAKEEALAAAEKEKEEAAKAREEAFLAGYPYQVELSSYYACSFVLSIDGQAKTFIKVNVGMPDSFRMHGSAAIENASCDVYSADRPPYRTAQSEITVKVNGSPYLPKWMPTGKLDARNYNVPYYQAIIAPAH